MSTEVDSGVSMKDMCEHIAKAGFLERDGVPLTAEQIYNYSPSGELFMVFQWYELASYTLGVRCNGAPHCPIKSVAPNGDYIRGEPIDGPFDSNTFLRDKHKWQAS